MDLVGQLRNLGVAPGGVLLVHSSFRAVRPIEGGPAGLIDALARAVDGTLVMPAWSGDDDNVFDPATAPVDVDLGVVAATFARRPGVLRSDHPFAFAASGPQAQFVVGDGLPLPPHRAESPVGRVYDLDGQVLLLGVGHHANTTLHLAELLAGAPYRTPKYCTVLRDGRPTRVDYGENDHCCQGFALADAWLGDLQRIGIVGNAPARLFRSRDLVRVATAEIARDPLVFLHEPAARCEECDAARASAA